MSNIASRLKALEAKLPPPLPSPRARELAQVLLDIAPVLGKLYPDFEMGAELAKNMTTYLNNGMDSAEDEPELFEMVNLIHKKMKSDIEFNQNCLAQEADSAAADHHIESMGTTTKIR